MVRRERGEIGQKRDEKRWTITFKGNKERTMRAEH